MSASPPRKGLKDRCGGVKSHPDAFRRITCACLHLGEGSEYRDVTGRINVFQTAGMERKKKHPFLLNICACI